MPQSYSVPRKLLAGHFPANVVLSLIAFLGPFLGHGERGVSSAAASQKGYWVCNGRAHRQHQEWQKWDTSSFYCVKCICFSIRSPGQHLLLPFFVPKKLRRPHRNREASTRSSVSSDSWTGLSLGKTFYFYFFLKSPCGILGQ